MNPILTVLLSLLWTLQLPLPKMVEIPGGRSYMGTLNPSVENRDETYREVCLSAFLMSETEITNAQYEAFDPAHKALRGYKGFSNDDDEAVVMVSWEDAQAYCRWLSNRTGRHFRLPTEEEWEYACRAGTTTAYNTGETYPEAFWKVQRNTRNKVPVSLRVAQFPPNAWGLYDMHGNVWEWCADRGKDELEWATFDWKAESKETETDPKGPAIGKSRFLRGGSWRVNANDCRSSIRIRRSADSTSDTIGFRLACPAGAQ